jgi:Fur family transcriptional regulator, ferric uptake regulator
MVDHSQHSSVALIEDLRGQGHKITTPRHLVIEHLSIREDNFSAEELVESLAPIGRATIYRTLKLLADRGLICKVVLEDGSARYRVNHGAHHHHLICVSCGATEDISRCGVDEVLDSVRLTTGYEIVGHRTEVYGVCPDCRSHPSTG